MTVVLMSAGHARGVLGGTINNTINNSTINRNNNNTNRMFPYYVNFVHDPEKPYVP